MSNSERATVQLPPEKKERLAEIADEAGISESEVLRRAVSVYEWMIDQLDAQGKVVVETDDGVNELHHLAAIKGGR